MGELEVLEVVAVAAAERSSSRSNSRGSRSRGRGRGRVAIMRVRDQLSSVGLYGNTVGAEVPLALLP